MFGVCNLSIIPLRIEPSDRSEIVSQVLFGEHFEVLEQQKQWTQIRLQYDAYEGWIDTKQFRVITQKDYLQLSDAAIVLNSDLVEYVAAPGNLLMPIPLGASLAFLDNPDVNAEQFGFEGLKIFFSFVRGFSTIMVLRPSISCISMWSFNFSPNLCKFPASKFPTAKKNSLMVILRPATACIKPSSKSIELPFSNFDI